MVKVKFWWEGISPTYYLSAFEYSFDTDFQVSTNNGRTWRSPQNGATIGTVAEWMIDNDKTVVNAELIHRKSRPRWRGLYILSIA